MFRFASSLLASAALVFFAASAFGSALAPSQPKIIATVVAHAHQPHPAWVAAAPHGL